MKIHQRRQPARHEDLQPSAECYARARARPRRPQARRQVGRREMLEPLALDWKHENVSPAAIRARGVSRRNTKRHKAGSHV